MTPFVFDDGGRKVAGYKGETGDCATRALAIATGRPYQEVYDAINEAAQTERPGSKRRSGRRSSARTGVFKNTFKRYMESVGWKFTPTMAIGSGCKVHLRSEELPAGRLIVALSRHWCAVIDGVIHDTDPDVARDGMRCVYGYWQQAGMR